MDGPARSKPRDYLIDFLSIFKYSVHKVPRKPRHSHRYGVLTDTPFQHGVRIARGYVRLIEDLKGDDARLASRGRRATICHTTAFRGDRQRHLEGLVPVEAQN